MMTTLSGQIVDLIQRRIYPGIVSIESGSVKITPDDTADRHRFILPGFIDSHIHIESSMLVPSEFARLATPHGTVATVSDPHEIGNVLGIAGIRYMIENGKQVPFHFYFGAPSCVPATNFETSGSSIGPEEIQQLFEKDHLHYLSEMMNFPGVLHHDPNVMKKIEIAQKLDKPIDGHAPGLMGEDAIKYIEAGITTDHECFSLQEALHKVKNGMKILIREGSAAKNYEALHPLISMYPHQVMFCSDDKHPHELVKGHINELVKRSIQYGYDLFDVLCCASLHPIHHYHLKVGLLQQGDQADFIVVDNLKEFNVLQTYIKGTLVAQNGRSFIERKKIAVVNHFSCSPKKPEDFRLSARQGKLQVIQAIDGQLITQRILMDPFIKNGNLISDTSRDLLKISVVNRYQDTPPAVAFIHHFGLKKGAIASCIAHDSHNIIAVGVTDDEICAAVNAIIAHQGGISVANGKQTYALPLPVAGIMSDEDGYLVAKKYTELDSLAKELGTDLQAPFMTLSFMALLVIPSLKLSDKGLFDGQKFAFTQLINPV